MKSVSPVEIPRNPDAVIVGSEFDEIHRVSEKTRKRMKAAGDFPPIVKLSPQRWGIVWRDYLIWRDARRVMPEIIR